MHALYRWNPTARRQSRVDPVRTEGGNGTKYTNESALTVAIMTTAIESLGLTKYFQGQAVVDHLEFSVAEGEIFGFLGPNGAGKTTTVRMLTTIITPDEGSARIRGRDVCKDGLAVRQQIGVVTQRGGGYWYMSFEDNVRLYFLAQGLSWRNTIYRTREVLDAFDLTQHRHKKLQQLSGGLHRRMQVARVLGLIRPVLFVDEPTTGLDPVSRRQIWEALLQAKRAGRTVFLTTQSMEEAQAITDRVCLIRDGRILACEATDVLRRRFGTTRIRLYFEPSATSSLQRLGSILTTIEGIISVHVNSGTICISLSGNNDNALPTILQLVHLNGRGIRTMEVEPATLEEAYLRLMGESI